MYKKSIIICVTCLVFLCLLMTACSETSKNNMSYWFSENETSFVEYDSNANSGSGNIDEAGSYWKMTAKNDMELTISIRNDSLGMYSSTYLYINGTRVKAEKDDWYEFVYKNLSLKKGDKLVFHAFWTNSLATDSNGFKMSVFSISDGTGNYLIEDIEKI